MLTAADAAMRESYTGEVGVGVAVGISRPERGSGCESSTE